jgi:transcriptional regulator with GAF, ATPase, and Fis domain
LVIRLENDVTEKLKIAQALAFRSRELQKAQLQLEKLFEISREWSTKGSITELINFLYSTISEIFPGADNFFLIIDYWHQKFLTCEGCHPHIREPLSKVLHRIDLNGLTADFIRYLEKIKDPHIITFAEREQLPAFMQKLSEDYSSGFGLPIFAQQICIGFFFSGSDRAPAFPQEDLHFCQALLGQVAGYIHHLVGVETEINIRCQQMNQRTNHGDLIGNSKKIQEIYDLIDLVAGSDATVLITGENGTGKELVARAIHQQSKRSRGPFVVANCSAYSPTLLESELFGHEKGAFTGAIRRKIGRFERAIGGTLFLDEIGEIAPATQILLLRFLQDHCFERVGGETTIEADVRVLAATNKDLYYRLNVIAIHLPPLKDRKEDIPLLCRHFLDKCSRKEGKKISHFSGNALQVLMDYDWPGNVRQLENAISHAVVLAQGGVIRKKHLPRFLKEISEEAVATSLAEHERHLILRVMKESNWNKHEAAKRLQVSRSTLYSKIARYGLMKG